MENYFNKEILRFDNNNNDKRYAIKLTFLVLKGLVKYCNILRPNNW